MAANPRNIRPCGVTDSFILRFRVKGRISILGKGTELRQSNAQMNSGCFSGQPLAIHRSWLRGQLWRMDSFAVVRPPAPCRADLALHWAGRGLDPTPMKARPKTVVVSVQDKLPPVGFRVIVVCKQSRCLGYIDRHGIWRDDAHHTELDDVIGWMEI